MNAMERDKGQGRGGEFMLEAWLTYTDGLTFLNARMGSIAAK
jgi:hypothetical protein